MWKTSKLKDTVLRKIAGDGGKVCAGPPVLIAEICLYQSQRNECRHSKDAREPTGPQYNVRVLRFPALRIDTLS